MKKHDDVIWLKHMPGLGLTIGKRYGALINAERVELLPMKAGLDGRPTHGWRVEGPQWATIAKGDDFELDLLGVSSVQNISARAPERRGLISANAVASHRSAWFAGDGAIDQVVGIDFAGPQTASQQRKKILAVAALRLGPKAYRVSADGMNERLLENPPGWTANELAESLVQASPRASVVACDFPFSIPGSLMQSSAFAALADHPTAFGSWQSFHEFMCTSLALSCPVDLGRFSAWKNTGHWTRRSSDVATGAQPPLKHQYQVLFNMTLLGNVFLGCLRSSGLFDVVPFDSRGKSAMIEIYPGHAMRLLGVPNYKRSPLVAIAAILQSLKGKGVSIDVDRRIRNVCETYNTGKGASFDHDAADAFVALCVGILHREGLATEFPGADADAREVEGAIWSI